jgi:hypothetical protein
MANVDLFVPVVDQKRWHPNFERLLATITPQERLLLQDWRTGFDDRDGNFLIEFQTKFNPAFWELYLFACTKELRLSVSFEHPRPDFEISGDAPFLIEAVTTSNAADGEPEWSRDLGKAEKLDMKEIVETASIRLANSMSAKYKKYLEEYRLLPHVVERPFVIAVAPFEQPFFFMQNQQAIHRVLYGIDEVKWVQGLEGIVSEHRVVDAIQKPNGAEIPVGLFTDVRMRHVSAVIYSSTATWSKVTVMAQSGIHGAVITQRYDAAGTQPRITHDSLQEYREGLLEGLNIYHNPFADYPLTTPALSHNDITHSWIENDSPIPFSNCRDGALYQRIVQSLRTKI